MHEAFFFYSLLGCVSSCILPVKCVILPGSWSVVFGGFKGYNMKLLSLCAYICIFLLQPSIWLFARLTVSNGIESVKKAALYVHACLPACARVISQIQ